MRADVGMVDDKVDLGASCQCTSHLRMSKNIPEHPALGQGSLLQPEEGLSRYLRAIASTRCDVGERNHNSVHCGLVRSGYQCPVDLGGLGSRVQLSVGCCTRILLLSAASLTWLCD